jgi:hypothetical protein
MVKTRWYERDRTMMKTRWYSEKTRWYGLNRHGLVVKSPWYGGEIAMVWRYDDENAI